MYSVRVMPYPSASARILFLVSPVILSVSVVFTLVVGLGGRPRMVGILVCGG